MISPAHGAKDHRRWYRGALLTQIAVKLWLVCAQPVVAIGAAIYDDRLFIQLASDILQGKWLGSYSEFTLMKGPMFSLWIAATTCIGLPLPLANHLLYLVGCLFLIRVLRPHLGSHWWAFTLFTLLWWQPMSYEMPVLGRVLRQNFYTPMTLVWLGALCAVAGSAVASSAMRCCWGVLLGVSTASLWLTREEGLWLIPCAGILLGKAAWDCWRNVRSVSSLVMPLMTAVVTCAVGIASVCALNYRHYGWFGTVEFRAPEFVSAYGALQRPVTDEDIHYVPVTRAMRQKLYDVSPAFAELRPWLEGNLGRAWAGFSSPVNGLPAEQLEIAGGWFMWALRDAVAKTHRAATARDALDFYSRIASEVNAACDSGLVGQVRARHDTMLPPWQPQHLRRLKATWRDYLEYFFLWRGFSPYPTASYGSAQLLLPFRDLTGWALSPSPEAPELDRPLRSRYGEWRLIALRSIGKTFRWICAGLVVSAVPVAVWLALVGLARRPNSPLLCVAFGCLGSALAVLLINFLVHVLAFPNKSPGAFAQGYPLLVVFGVTTWAAVFARPDRDQDAGHSATSIATGVLRALSRRAPRTS